jgi:hypothetical protein
MEGCQQNSDFIQACLQVISDYKQSKAGTINPKYLEMSMAKMEKMLHGKVL